MANRTAVKTVRFIASILRTFVPQLLFLGRVRLVQRCPQAFRQL